jgi:hypothetical protein
MESTPTLMGNFCVISCMNRLWLILFLFSQPFSQTTVAVLEFETEGLDNISSSALSSIVRREVRNNKEYRLIDRNMMKAVLEEQGFQQSGCVSSECAVQVGELLGVQKMVTGTISGLGSLYLIEIFVLDVATGLIEKSEMFEHVGRVEELIKPLRDNTKKLFGAKSSEIAQETFLYIESNPPGGMVYVNNNNIGSSPIKYKVEPGDYKVTIKTQGYQDWMQIATVELGENKVLSGDLVKFESTEGGSAGGSGIGEWVFWGISQQDYIRLIQLNITKLEWSETFQPNNLTVEIIDDYKSLKFPKHLWVTIYKTNVPINIASKYFQWSIPIDRWSNLYNSEFGKIPINIASKYFQWSIPFDRWSNTYQSGISVEQIISLESKHKLDISILYKYFKEIKFYGFDDVQTDLMEIKFLVLNFRLTEIIVNNASSISSNNKLSKDDFLKEMLKIDGGSDVFFTNDFSKLNNDTQRLVYRYLDEESYNYIKVVKKINKFKNLFIKGMNKSQVGGFKERKVLHDGLSIGNIVFMYVNDMKIHYSKNRNSIPHYMKVYVNFIFAEI